MLGLLRKPLPHADDIAWMFEAYEYWLVEMGGADAIVEEAVLARPERDDFPVDEALEGRELAADYLGFVLQHAGCAEMAEELGVAPGAAPLIGGAAPEMDAVKEGPETLSDALLFELTGETTHLLYDPDYLVDPSMLVTQLARGLAQLLLISDERVEPETMEPDEWLAFADVGAVAMGFGLFVGTSALRYEQGGDTNKMYWTFRRQGHLGQMNAIYALAIYAELCGIADDAVIPYLEPDPKALFRAHRKDLRSRRGRQLATLAQAEAPPETGPYR